MKTIDPREVENIVNDIFDVDEYENSIASFSSLFNQEIIEFSEIVCECHKKYQLIDKIKEPSEKQLEAGGYVYLTFDNVYTSWKLLFLGYITPSGNMLRQSYEAACMSILLSSKTKIKVTSKVKIDFFEEYKKENSKTKSHLSLKHILNNQDDLGINERGISGLIEMKEFYNKYSHSTRMSLASRLSSHNLGSWMVGGGYDSAKEVMYKHEITNRINYIKVIPDFIEESSERIKSA